MPSRTVSPGRTLAGAFFARFFESDLTATADDLKAPLFYLIAALAMPGVFVPLLMQGNSPTDPAGWGWSMIAHYRGPDVLRAVSRADKTLYLAYAMFASALVGLLTWTTLVPDRRDRLILGALPIRPAAIVRAKLAALGAYAGLVTAAMHALASISFGFFLAAGSGVGFAVRGMAAHFLASLAAGAFVLLSIAAAQGLALALAGPRRFARVSPLVPIAAVAGVVAFVPLVAPIVGSVVATLADRGGARPWILLTPPLWFLGLYERILGTNDPALVALSRTAVAALGAVAAATICSYPLAYRRLMIEEGARPRTRVKTSVLTPPRGQAPAAQFFVATLRRSPRHGFVVAGALGLASPWAMSLWLSHARPATPHAELLALSLAEMMCALGGLRLAAALPASLEPAWLFDLAPVPRRDARRAVERVMLAAAIIPPVAVSSASVWYVAGAANAGIHALVGLACGTLMVQVLLWRFGTVPCTAPWSWRSAVRWAPGYVASGLAIVRGVPLLELVLFREPAAGALFAAYVLTVAWGIRAHAERLPVVEPADPVDVLTSAMRAAIPGGESTSPDRTIATLQSETPRSFRITWRAALLAVRPFRGELRVSLLLAARRLTAAPVFSTFSILTLACGIGLTTATYSVLRSVLWTPSPVSEPERLVDVSGLTGRAGAASRAFSLPDFEDLQARQTAFSALAAATVTRSALVGDGIAEFVTGEAVNGGYFRAFGLRPRVGRLIEPEDDRPGAVPVAVLSYNVWRLRFGGDAGVIGHTVKIDGQVHQVVGVAPEHFGGWEFGFRSQLPAIWIPLSTAAGEVRDRRDLARRDFRWLVVKARLAPRRSIEQASAEMAAIGRGVDAEFPAPGSTSGPTSGRRWSAGPILARDRAGVSIAGTAALAAVGLVLLIGCTTLANLALARGASRAQERGVQRALGASRGRLVREQLVESGMVTAAGGLVAVPIAGALMAYVTREVPLGSGTFVLVDPHVDPAVLLVACAASVLALAIAGVWPALELTRRPLWTSLGSAGLSTPMTGRVHRRLIAGQVAGSMALFLVAAACIQAIVANARHDSGVDVDRLAMVRVAFDLNHRDEAAGRRTIDEVLRAARHLKRVDVVAASSGLPFGVGGSGSWSLQTVDGAADEAVQLVAGTPDLLATLGVPLISGRPFDDRDRQGMGEVGIVSASLARRLFGAGGAAARPALLVPHDPRGGQAPARLTIVGVAGDTDAVHLGSRDVGVVYVPLAQHYRGSALFTVRTSSDPRAALAALKSALQQVDPDLAIDLAQTATQVVGPYGAIAVIAAIVTTFGSIALVLTMAGLFGVVSQVVTGRMRELGVRVALGAGRERIIVLVLADGLRPVVNGLTLGLVLGAAGRLAVGSFLGRPVAAVDPIAFVAVPILLAAAAVGACYLPARRAASVDPSVALRTP
jgi:putative ABC transport system permease protein